MNVNIANSKVKKYYWQSQTVTLSPPSTTHITQVQKTQPGKIFQGSSVLSQTHFHYD